MIGKPDLVIGLLSDIHIKLFPKSDPVAAAAERREKLLEKIKIIDDCALAIDGGRWYASIIQNVCIGRSYEQLDRALMPTSDKNAYFKHRRTFFELLDKKKTN